jgi:acetylornithine deacetylase
LKDTRNMIDQDRLIELAQRLIRFPSPQTERMEAEPQVQAFIGECVAPIVAGMGLKARRDAMGNLIAEAGTPGAEASVLLMAYAMTHPQSRMREPWHGSIIETREGTALRGRGVSEQKAPLAAMLAAMQACLADLGKPDGHLIFVLSSAGETGRHDAARAALSALASVPRMGVIGLGTNNRIALGNKGRVDIDILVRGRATHSSTPWEGIDAIEGARQVLDRLRSIELPTREHPQLGRVTLTPTRLASSPLATHTVQDEVLITLDRRLLPGEDPEAAFEHIAREARLPAPWQVEVRKGPFMFPCEIAADGPLVRALRQGHALADLPQPSTFYSHSALDAGFLATRGCETAMWGPGRMEQFHSDEEFTLVSELVSGARGYAAFLRYALASPQTRTAVKA